MITVETGSQTDCADVLTILQTAFAPYADLLNPPSGVTRETKQTLQEKLATNTLLLAKDGQTTVGCVLYKQHEDDPRSIYFGRLAVLPAWQKQGIARQLVAQVEQAAQSNNDNKVVLYVRKILTSNVGFFQSCGYEIYAEGTHSGFTEPTYYKMVKAVNAKA